MNCSHCGESMRNRQAMDEHMEKNHADKAANRCLTCGTYFHSIRSQAQHRCKSKPAEEFSATDGVYFQSVELRKSLCQDVPFQNKTR